MKANENSSGGKQLESLLDLLIDLQLVNNSTPETSKAPPQNFSVKIEEKIDDLLTNQDGEIINSLRELEEKLNDNVSDEGEKNGESLIVEPIKPLIIETPQLLSQNIPETTEIKSSFEQLNLETPQLLSQNIPEPTEIKSSFQQEWENIKAAEARQKQSAKSQQPQEFNPPKLLCEVELDLPELEDKHPEQVFDRLIKSQMKRVQENQFSNPIAATDHESLDNSIELFERWQRLTLTQQMMDYRELINKFQIKLETLDNQVNDPTRLINLIVPLITAILSRQILESRQESILALAPIVDGMIQEKTEQDREAMSSALSPVLADAITRQVTNSPGEFAKALGPEMGNAIKEQIHLERDAMVDALYPVIGSTVSKYFAEAIRTINEKVESTFSLEGVSRKIRAKMQGVTEAELIFREAVPFTIQAIFLIQKTSGLVISEVQPPEKQQLESEMVAGMLTAIRSFVNDCIAQSGEISEIDQIDYGNSKIILEVAGYCYLAVVTQGELPKIFKQKMRAALSNIVLKYSQPIETFDGDPNNVPQPIQPILQNLAKVGASFSNRKKPLTPIGLIIVSLGIFAAISIPLGINHHLSKVARLQEEKVNLALASDPELALYRLGVEANRGTMKLSGRLPNRYLSSKAAQVAKQAEPKLKITNAIIPVEVPADPVKAQADVNRVINLLNQMDGAVLAADFKGGKVTVQGTVLQEADAKKVTEAFKEIPGVQSVTNTVQLQPLAIASRVYFDQGSSEIKSTESSKITQIKAFLDQFPTKNLKLVGHTDPKGSDKENQQLALERATKVKDVLLGQGVDPKRLQVEGTIDAPIGIKGEQVPLLSRCVEFRISSP
jgi:outer membrane protein OmpA-like peptidoglycan-associated protein